MSHEPRAGNRIRTQIAEGQVTRLSEAIGVTLPLQTAGSNHGALGPLPFGVEIGRKRFSVVLFPGANSTPALPPKLSPLPLRISL